MRVLYRDILFALWLLCVFVVFMPIPVYPPFLILFSIAAVAEGIRGTAKSNGQLLWLVLWCLVMFALGLVSHVMYSDTSVFKYWIKLVTNFGFLLASVVFFQKHGRDLRARMIWLEGLLLGILVLSAGQVLLNAVRADMLLMPFQGRVDSAVAGKIVGPGVYFGIPEKNIWALKLCYTTIILLLMHRFGLSQLTRRGFALAVFLGLVCVLWTFSRTAQLLLLLPMGWLLVTSVLRSSVRWQKWLLGGLLVLASPLALYEIYDKLFRIDFTSMGDGFATRLVMWSFFLKILPDLNIWIGNGLLFGHTVLPDANRFEIYFHNIFMDVLADYGVFGIIALLMIYWQIYFRYPEKGIRRLDIFVCLFLPMFIAVNSQAMFLEVDVVIFMAASLLLRQASQSEVTYEHRPVSV